MSVQKKFIWNRHGREKAYVLIVRSMRPGWAFSRIKKEDLLRADPLSKLKELSAIVAEGNRTALSWKR
jgi:hypothetical protein